jgi:hypothetical protein
VSVSTPTKRPGKPSGSKLTVSIIAGMMLIPVSAVAAVMMTDHEPTPAVAEDTTTTVATQPPPSVAEIVYANVGATAEDLEYACGEGGQWLVDAETSETITPVQQAALDALRGICEGQGTPLPGKAAPPPLVQTRTVTVAVPAPAPPAPAASAEDELAAEQQPSDAQASDDASEGHEQAPTETTTAPPSSEDDDHSSDDSSASSSTPAMGTLERYQAVYAQAVTEIDHAVSEGGSLEKIGEARAKLAEAEAKAANGEYEGATTQAYEAIGKAREAIGERDD